MSRANPQAREHMLARIRKALNAEESDAERRYAAHKRLADPPRGTVPAQGRLRGKARLEQFCEKLKAQAATVTVTPDADAVPELIADFLRSHNLPSSLAMGADALLAGLPWHTVPGITRRQGPARGDDLVALSRAWAGVAETGTLVLISGAANPTTLNFLPETQIVVVQAEDLVGGYEEIWQRLEAEHGHRMLPRTVNFVSGPSRTADIEQTIVMGAHGPRQLHVIIVGQG